MEEKLNWSEFDAADRSLWRKAADKALKGKEFSQWLEWTSRNNIRLESYKDLEDFNPNGAVPGSPPWTRGPRREGNDWIICDLFSATKNLSNAAILSSLAEGVNGLMLQLEDQKPKIIEALLKEVMFEILDVQLYCDENSTLHTEKLLELAAARGIGLKGLKAAVLNDVLHSTDGSYNESELDQVLEASLLSANKATLIRTVLVDQRSTQNRGAGPALDMALALAKGHEYLLKLMEKGLSVDQAGALFQFNFSLGPEYLEEIARLRAFRALWHQIIAQYNPAYSCSSGIHIHAENALWLSSVNDAHNNLLRNTSVAMSAALGGCDSLFLHPYDAKLKEKESQAERISRNIQFILRDEAYFNKVADPTGGAYFIEDATQKMGDRAWELFQAIESEGGYLAAGKKGILDQWIASDAKELIEDYKSGRKTWIGVNKYPPKNQKIENPESPISAMDTLELELIKLKEGKA